MRTSIMYSLKIFIYTFILKVIFIYTAKLYETFEGCTEYKSCIYKTDQEMLIAYAKGLPNIQNKYFDEDFIICNELKFLCGYVPKNSDKKISKNAGVTIGMGFELRDKSEEYLNSLHISQNIINKLSPYLGRSGNSALALLKKNKNLTLSESEINDISSKYNSLYLKKLTGFYFNLTNSRFAEEALKANKTLSITNNFNDLHLSIKTALFSYFFNKVNYLTFIDDQKGMIFSEIFQVIAINDWKQLAEILESEEFNKSRRKAEALLLKSFQKTCNTEMYLSILMDESGSITLDQFSQEVNFVNSLINKFSSNDKIYFSLLTFNNDVTILSDFTSNKQAVLQALKNHKKINGGTNTADALLNSRSLFINTPSYINKQLDSRITLVITDGGSDKQDMTLKQANLTRLSGIEILSVGVGNSLNLNELNLMSGGEKNVLLISDFSQLMVYLDTLNAGVCTQNAQLENNQIFFKQLNNQEDTIYMKIEKNATMNQKIILNDTPSENKNTTDEDDIPIALRSSVVICASYQDPYPDEHSSELCHLGENEGLKELVIYNKKTAEVLDDFNKYDFDEEKILAENIILKRNIFLNYEPNSRIEKYYNHMNRRKINKYRNNKYWNIMLLENENFNNSTADEKEILYISVRGKNLNFTIQTQECDPMECKVGTNDKPHKGGIIIIFVVVLIIFAIVGIMIFAWIYHKKAKNAAISDIGRFEPILNSASTD